MLAIVIFGYFSLQLDRSNISNALTGTITTDLGISTNDVNLGNQLQLMGIVILEIPSNMLLQKVGPQRWLVAQIFSWGTIATLQALCRNKASFYVTRFLLGAFEGGYIPGSMYLFATFYTRSETATRYAIFYIGNYVATGTGSLIAAGVLQMQGISGISGWRWLFISE